MLVQQSIHIDAPAEKIWPFLVEPEKIMQWCITFLKFEYAGDQHEGIGTPIHIKEQSGPMKMDILFEVTEWNKHEKIAFHKVSGSGPESYWQEWATVSDDSGSTFSFREEIIMPWGVIGRIIESLAKGISQKTVDEMLTMLKRLVEQPDSH